jgi:hypothetical protein
MKFSKLNRKIHRYLGIITGIQFLLWTISGLYFSWTNLDDIHGDTFRLDNKPVYFDSLLPVSQISIPKIKSIELRDIDNNPFYWINDSILVNAKNGKFKNGISKIEAVQIANRNVIPSLKIDKVELLKNVSNKDEYRNKKTPVYKISYLGNDNVVAYISEADGKFQSIRHDRWRIFDFLWMTHTMDYEGKDNINNLTLRIFSFLGLVTSLSGFLLFFTSNKKIIQYYKNKNRISNQQ